MVKNNSCRLGDHVHQAGRDESAGHVPPRVAAAVSSRHQVRAGLSKLCMENLFESRDPTNEMKRGFSLLGEFHIDHWTWRRQNALMVSKASLILWSLDHKSVLASRSTNFRLFFRLERVCNKDTTVQGINIRKGMLVGVPVYRIHMDPRIWPEPEKFKPRRFMPEEKAKHSSYDWLPFGTGPRNCVAMRLAMLEVKLAVAYIVRKFKIVRSVKTEVNSPAGETCVQVSQGPSLPERGGLLR